MLTNKKLHLAFSQLSFHTGTERHDQNTRNRGELIMSNPRHSFAFASIQYSIPKAVNAITPDN